MKRNTIKLALAVIGVELIIAVAVSIFIPQGIISLPL
jgi:hypothetical protein